MPEILADCDGRHQQDVYSSTTAVRPKPRESGKPLFRFDTDLSVARILDTRSFADLYHINTMSIEDRIRTALGTPRSQFPGD